MHKSGNDFTLIQNLIKGQYIYKFLVDNEIKIASDQVIN